MADSDKSVTRVLTDGHGGDAAPGMVLDALEQICAADDDGLKLGIVGMPEMLEPELKSRGIESKVELVEASQVVDMCEPPATALRHKRDSSIHVGARKVRDSEWDAFVSAGNTGALMAISKMILKTLPGVDRPAIASIIPALNGYTLLLDAGANVECTSEHLVQFALMGSCFMHAANDIDSPRVGLLNIGSEDIKGTDVIKVAASTLRQTDINFIGNTEGTDIFFDSVDVVVCDGFVGNVALKTMEGLARFIMHHLKRELTSDFRAKTGMLLAKGAMRRFRENIDPAEYNGAPLLGLNGIVVKSHGSADVHAYISAVNVARRQCESGLSGQIVEAMHQWAVA